MRIGLQSWGSEGDIRPFLALGHGLAKRGHEVELVYTDFEDRQFESIARSLGFRARPVAMPVVSPEELTRIGLKIAAVRDPLTEGKLIFDRLLIPISDRLYEAALELCDRSDLIVRHAVLHQVQAAAEKRGRVTATLSFTHNLVPSRTMTPTGLPRLGTWGNALEWKLARFVVNRLMRPEINRFRSRVGLGAIGDLLTEGWPSRQLNLITVSSMLCRRPQDWPAQHQVTGFLQLTSPQETLTADAEAFLADGPPPVFMGFGSLMPRDRPNLDETVAIFRDAVARAQVRAIVHVPPDSTEPRGRDGDVLVVGRLPHAVLFPRCAAIVHHGGAGTTHTTLMAGVPSIVVPHVADQFFWADELRRVGVAARPLRRRQLTAARLASRIRETVGRSDLRERAQALAPLVRRENGVERAAELIEQLGPPALAGNSSELRRGPP